MTIAGNILLTKIACYVPSLKELDVPSNRWVSFAVDLFEVISIKEFNPEDEDAGDGIDFKCSVIYTNNNNYLVIEDFEDLFKVWCSVKNGENMFFAN
jgi:hypothetical protein